jgi:hypothetical protein
LFDLANMFSGDEPANGGKGRLTAPPVGADLQRKGAFHHTAASGPDSGRLEPYFPSGLSIKKGLPPPAQQRELRLDEGAAVADPWNAALRAGR